MKQRLTHFFALFLAGSTLIGSSCAGSYTPIRPSRVATYQSSATSAPLQFGYQFDALNLRGRNKKYLKKERKNSYRVVAVQIKNNTDADVNFSRDAVLYYGDRAIIPVPSATAYYDLKQGVAIYLLYLLLNVTVTTNSATSGFGSSQTSSSNTTFIPTGPFIAGGNILGAAQANKNFRRELEEYDLTNRTIRPGETVYGLLCLRELNVAPLRLELRSPAASPVSPVPPAPAQALPPAGSPSPTH